MQEIELKLTIEEANLILEGLGSMPFRQVFALIGKIQNQAAQQLKPASQSALKTMEQPNSSPTIKVKTNEK